MAREGFEPAAILYSRLKAAELEEDVEAAKREAFHNWKAEYWGPVMKWIEGVYEALSEAVREQTGMTLEDFLWLRDFEEEEDK
jgi:hypothetical protein